VKVVFDKADSGDDDGPIIDRSGGPGGKKRLTVMK
jgi:hypothetical protein